MADIPVERRSTGNWWKWLLGLALLALAIWLIAALLDPGMGEPGEGVEDPIEQPTEQPGEQPPEQSSEQPGEDVGPGADADQEGVRNGAPPALEGVATAGWDETFYPRAERIDITIAEG